MSLLERISVATDGYRGGGGPSTLLILSDGDLEVDLLFDATTDPVVDVAIAAEVVAVLDSETALELTEPEITLEPETNVERSR